MGKSFRLNSLSIILMGCLALTSAGAQAADPAASLGLPGFQVPAEIIRGPGFALAKSGGSGPVVVESDQEDTAAFVAFRQPWTPPAAAFRSRVVTCDDPRPLDRVAMDDFGFNVSGNAIRLRWWGVLTNGQQIGKSYYIAVYKDSNCRPDTHVYKACVTPQVLFQRIDCTQQRVFRFDTPIPPLAVSAGQKYWIQISENDAGSATPGVDDFFWSGRQPVRGCRALQTFDFIEYRTLVDPCNDRPDDLSFEILVQTP